MRRSASTHRVEWQLLTCSSSYMRRSFDGLALAVQERLGEDPQSGSLFVFIKSQSGSSGLIASLLRASRGRGRRRLRRRRSSRWPRTDGEVDRYGDVTAERPALLINAFVGNTPAQRFEKSHALCYARASTAWEETVRSPRTT